MLSIVLSLLACIDQKTVNHVYFDSDRDGFTSEFDCDDENNFIYPTAREICDGIDNDCDDLIDDEDDSLQADAWYRDGDGDGFGVGEGTMACDAPLGMVDNGDDCDDSNAQIYPTAEEICDEIDNDCDGLIDDADELNANSATVWYVDSDGDAFGDGALPVYACIAPEGAVELGIDCNDADASMYPDALEICDDVDNDCDGLIDEQEMGQAQCDSCTDMVLSSNTGVVATGQVSMGDEQQLSCFYQGGLDRVFRWNAPAAGMYIFQSTMSNIAILEDCSEELACSNTGTITTFMQQGQTIQLVVDSDDTAMPFSVEIWAVEELVCHDGLDDDNDGLVDCDDEADCWFNASCAAGQCPNFDLVDLSDYQTPLNGENVAVTSLYGREDVEWGSCFVEGAGDFSFSYTAVSNGCAQIFATSNQMEVQLAVMDSCGGVEIDCNDGSPIATSIYGAVYGSYVPLQMSVGEEYIIVVNGVSLDARDRFSLHIERNDYLDCAGNLIE